MFRMRFLIMFHCFGLYIYDMYIIDLFFYQTWVEGSMCKMLSGA